MGEWRFFTTLPFYPQVKNLSTLWIADQVDPRVGLDAVEEGNC
jgi:hypothetical protein